jgi:hypothetical protein
VKHAGPDALGRLSGLIDRLREVDGLVEKRPGVFYRRSKACVHFHEDPTGLFADVRLEADGDFERVPVSTVAEQRRLLAAIAGAVQP